MKPDIHPASGPVVFRDLSADTTFLIRSTLVTRLGAYHPRIEWHDGQTYPVVDVDVSSASHPFWTGKGRVLDTAGRVERFNKRYGRETRPQNGENDAAKRTETA